MQKYAGKPIYKGTVIGKVFFYSKNHYRVKRETVNNPDTQIARYRAAIETAKAQLRALYNKAVVEVGESDAKIFEVHEMLLEEVDFSASVENIIRTEMVNAEYAVATTGDYFAVMFSKKEDEHFKAHSADIRDISERLVRVLSNEKVDMNHLTEPVILVADDLSPSEIVQLDRTKLLSFVTKHGSSNSHTAILARTMNLPSVTGVDTNTAWNGHLCIVDANEGRIIIDPDDETIKCYQERIKLEEKEGNLLETMKGQPNITKDGKEIKLYANIGNISDMAGALANEAEGIGLFRSEFLYLEKKDYPSEEEQFRVYKTAAQNMNGRKVVVRTMDIGADKRADYFNLDNEDNPAMGYRAIRICLDRIDMFKTQLRALYRASAYGNIAIMFPMIISVEEVEEILTICRDVRNELIADGFSFNDVELGIMIETPAAVMISAELAKLVDFFSIGTNDLTQYTLAIDHRNPKLDRYYNSHHEAVLRLIKIAVENGHSGGCRVGICGELGADTTLTERFIQMGLDELSVASPFLLSVRKAIRESVSTPRKDL